MRKVSTFLAILWVAGASIPLAPAAIPPPALLVVANAQTPSITEETLQKVYLGRIVQVEGRALIPVNLARGSSTRKEFMERLLSQEDDTFVAYWTVRRYIGKGSPPREFSSVEEQLEYIRNTPGAIGYVDASVELKDGLKALIRKP